MELPLWPNQLDISTAAVIIGQVGDEADVAAAMSERADAVLFDDHNLALSKAPSVPFGARVSTAAQAASLAESGASFIVATDPVTATEVAAAAGAATLVFTPDRTVHGANIVHILPAEPSMIGQADGLVAVDLATDVDDATDADEALGHQVAAHRAGARIIITTQVKRARRTAYTVDQLLQRQTAGVR